MKFPKTTKRAFSCSSPMQDSAMSGVHSRESALRCQGSGSEFRCFSRLMQSSAAIL